MEKIKNLFSVKNITKMVLIYVLLQPVLDILSFLNIRGYIPGISTVVKPLFVFGIGAYIFLTDKKSRKRYIWPYILYAILMIVHSLILKDLMIENSVIAHEIRFMVNLAYMLVLFMIFEFLYRANDNKEKFIHDLKNAVVYTFVIYCVTIIVAILTGTSAKTYEYADKTKEGFKGWLDSGQIFGHSLCIVFPYMIHYLFHKTTKNKFLFVLNKFLITLPCIVLALIGTKVTYMLDIAILGIHFAVDLFVGIRDKSKLYFLEAGLCLVIAVGLVAYYPYTSVKHNNDINKAVLAVDMSGTSEGTETNREDLSKMKDNLDNSNKTSWWEEARIERLNKYYLADVKASEELEIRYADGSLHPSDMRNRQLIYNSVKYKNAQLQYKIFGIGYLNQDGLLSLERDSLMLLFSFGILGFLIMMIKPIMIWIKSCVRLCKRVKDFRPTALYLFEGFSLFFCISLYAGYTLIYTNFSIYLVIVALLLRDSLKEEDNIFDKYFRKIFDGGRTKFYEKLEDDLKKDNKQFIITANPETIMTSEKDEKLQKAYLDEKTDVIPDGVGVIKGAKILGFDIQETILGVDVVTKLFEYADKYKKKIYLFGAKREVLDKLIERLGKDYSGAVVCGSTDGYVEDKQKVFDEIVSCEPDIVLVALGIPNQEKLIYENLDRFKKGIFVGVGGSFDVLSGMKKRAPKIFIKLRLEWLYRITVEPKRLKRFYQSNIKYILKVKRYEEI